MAETSEICQRCKFYDPVTDEEYGECKRYAPRPIQQGEIGDPPIWPTVLESMWCGDFENRQ